MSTNIGSMELVQLLATRAGTRHFAGCHGLADLAGIAEAKARPAFWLERLAARVAGNWAAERG